MLTSLGRTLTWQIRPVSPVTLIPLGEMFGEQAVGVGWASPDVIELSEAAIVFYLFKEAAVVLQLSVEAYSERCTEIDGESRCPPTFSTFHVIAQV